MTARNAPGGPYAIQANQHSAESFRQVVASLVAGSGVVGANDMSVTQNGTPNMSVNVASGFVFIAGSQAAPTQGSYHAYNDATVNLAIAAAPSSNSRIDIVVASVQDAAYSGASNQWLLQVITGTVAPSPVPAAAPANSVILAQIAVGTSVTSIVTANITDKRTFALLRSRETFATTAGGAVGPFSNTETIVQTLTIPAQGFPYRVILSAHFNGTGTVTSDVIAVLIRDTNVAGAALSTMQTAETGFYVSITLDQVKFDVNPDGAHTFVLTAVRAAGTGTFTTFGDPNTRLSATIVPL